MAKSKSGYVKLPKRIGAAKIPKVVRKGPLGDFLASKGGQAMLAEAVLAAGALLMTKRGADDKPDKGMSKSKKKAKGSQVIGAASAAPATLAYAFGEASKAFAEALKGRQPAEDGAPEAPDADWPVDRAVEPAARPH